MPRFDKLLVLDLDETLIYGTTEELDQPADFKNDDYYFYKRPGVDEFLTTCFEWFEVGIWTAAGEQYADSVLENLRGSSDEFAFVWSRDKCDVIHSLYSYDPTVYKKLKKLIEYGYDLEKIIIVDDREEVVVMNYGNAVIVNKFEGDTSDDELPLLLQYLETLGDVEIIRSIEKRYWRQEIYENQ